MLIDDQPEILDSLRFMLNTPCETATDPLQALERLLAYQPAITENIWLDLDKNSDLSDGMHRQPAMMDVKNILAISNITERLNDIYP